MDDLGGFHPLFSECDPIHIYHTWILWVKVTPTPQKVDFWPDPQAGHGWRTAPRTNRDLFHGGVPWVFLNIKLGGGFKYFVFWPLFGEDEPILTNMFQRAWNHQLEKRTTVSSECLERCMGFLSHVFLRDMGICFLQRWRSSVTLDLFIFVCCQFALIPFGLEIRSGSPLFQAFPFCGLVFNHDAAIRAFVIGPKVWSQYDGRVVASNASLMFATT